MKVLWHTMTRHAALLYVARGGTFPPASEYGHDAIRDELVRLIGKGAVLGDAVTGAELNLSPLAMQMLRVWRSWQERRTYRCRCRID